ncbi:hypothetical protein ACEQ8H_005069 [Pleosporales sp. CAS-2024a]
METPHAADQGDMTTTPDTGFSAIFDNNTNDSQLSSCPSSLDSDWRDRTDHAAHLQGCESQPQRNSSQQIDDVAAWDDYRGSAASQRQPRLRRKPPVFSGLLHYTQVQDAKQPALKATQAPITASDTAQQSCAKRKRQQTTLEAALKPQRKRLKTDTTKKPPQGKRNARTARPTQVPTPCTPRSLDTPIPTPSRQLRKRKTARASEPPEAPHPKKARTVPKAQPKPKRTARPASRRAKSTAQKHQKQEWSLLVQLKMSKHNLPSWFLADRSSQGSVTSQQIAETGQDTPDLEDLNHDLNMGDGEQFAQPLPPQIPFSSQTTAAGSSFQHQPSSAETQTAKPHLVASASQGDLLTRPCHPPEQIDIEQESIRHDATVQPPIVPATDELELNQFPEASSYETQPTQPLSQPLSFLNHNNLIVPGFSRAVSEAASDATTVDEEPLIAPRATNVSPEQSHLHKVAEQLLANRKPGMKKPPPCGRPEVWAEGRQELCETLHYYRAYQSGCYSTGGFARGFMFDKVAHERDYMDSDVVISRAGGGLVKDTDSGQMKSGRDQSDDGPVMTALKNCMAQYNPVVIITGADNPHMPSQPPHQYCVLDYFKPTHIWTEKSGKGKIVRFRFERLDTRKKSWWCPENAENDVSLDSLGRPVEETCASCGVSSMQIYLNGWMCLQPNCSAFWHVIEGSSLGSHRLLKEPDEGSLIYDPRFLKQKTPWPNDNQVYSLKFDGPNMTEDIVIPGEDTAQSFSSGIVCPDCGKCNSRIAWAGWECSNPSCSYEFKVQHPLITARSLLESFWPLNNSYTMSRDTHSPLLKVSVTFAHGYRINRYAIPGLDGFITHMIANKAVVEEEGGPHSMFEELQQADIGLRRRVMPNGQLKGDSHCRHFSVNYGMPYKFIAATASHSFDTAARPITATRSRLNWVARYLAAQEIAKPRLAQQDPNRSDRTPDYHALLAHEVAAIMSSPSSQHHPHEFNEVLALGYFESQKMNYHDDGEFGLGPTIATLSLGAPGTMRIRMKARHYHGCSSAGVYDDARPLPGCANYEARVKLQPDLDALKQSDPKAWRARLKIVPRELKLKHAGQAKDVLKMELGHGDVVVMHGAELQKYYEHAVEHAGRLRFALTCRYIDPESLNEADKPGYVVGPDLGGYDGSRLLC